ncbi:transposase [Luteolibacter sp. SL250]|uniref:REP-associated tyrosine transposase n=1 Tax=Luteolibacter sp. SL250 TaxID=2995170 RepID=UPI00227082D6|nr:transposase [Luteolibacter sp. SL250]WAC19908.1 transposase [Luteolibacter sp. SL250]
MSHKGIHDRGYLPHWDFDGSLQAITFRLGDALPDSVVISWKAELASLLEHPDRSIVEQAAKELRKRIARYEDSGHGSCILRNHGHILQEILISGHTESYKLIEWCIMPNHVHVLVKLLPSHSLGSTLQRWKGASSARINKAVGRSGTLWYPYYHDRFIRDFDHYYNSIAYIRNNPVKAGLCQHPSEWPLGSAGMEWSADFSPHLSPATAPPTKDAD